MFREELEAVAMIQAEMDVLKGLKFEMVCHLSHLIIICIIIGVEFAPLIYETTMLIQQMTFVRAFVFLRVQQHLTWHSISRKWLNTAFDTRTLCF